MTETVYEEKQGAIEAWAKPKENPFSGQIECGLKIDEDWYNIPGTEESLLKLQEDAPRSSVVKFKYKALKSKLIDPETWEVIEKRDAPPKKAWSGGSNKKTPEEEHRDFRDKCLNKAVAILAHKVQKDGELKDIDIKVTALASVFEQFIYQGYSMPQTHTEESKEEEIKEEIVK